MSGTGQAHEVQDLRVTVPGVTEESVDPKRGHTQTSPHAEANRPYCRPKSWHGVCGVPIALAARGTYSLHHYLREHLVPTVTLVTSSKYQQIFEVP